MVTAGAAASPQWPSANSCSSQTFGYFRNRWWVRDSVEWFWFAGRLPVYPWISSWTCLSWEKIPQEKIWYCDMKIWKSHNITGLVRVKGDQNVRDYPETRTNLCEILVRAWGFTGSAVKTYNNPIRLGHWYTPLIDFSSRWPKKLYVIHSLTYLVNVSLLSWLIQCKALNSNEYILVLSDDT